MNLLLVLTATTAIVVCHEKYDVKNNWKSEMVTDLRVKRDLFDDAFDAFQERLKGKVVK
jgi:hypothetical protein